MPNPASPASYIPGESLARGSLGSDPVIPAGNGGAVSSANGFPPAWTAGLDSGGFVGSGDFVGSGEVVCASVQPAKQEHKMMEAIIKRKVIGRTRFIVSPLQISHPACSA